VVLIREGLQAHSGGMPLSKDLLELPSSYWFNALQSVLLLNPRWPEALRVRVMAAEFPALEDHIWLATSGTGGRLKLVALARTALEASARAVNAHLGATNDDVWLNPLPLFHVGGLGIRVRAGLAGARGVELAGAWDPRRFVGQAEECGATLSSLVPTQVHDLVRAGCRAPQRLRAVVVGGGALSEALFAEARVLGWPLLPSYGLTEAGSQVATAVPEAAETSWLPLLSHVEARVDDTGVLELQGPSLLTGCMVFEENGGALYEDPKRDGWLRTSDRVELRGRELRMLGRSDDLVKIRGELVDVASLERALQERVRSGVVCLRADSDERSGWRLRVLAGNEQAAREAAKATEEVFPAYARPHEIVVGTIQRTALGKIVRR